MPPPTPPEDTEARYRSGAVARMLRMPVATLRIWERRYGVVAPVTSTSGHRLYTAADVQRLALLRQLTERGHAIGAIAALNMDQLHRVAATHVSTLAKPPAEPDLHAASAAPLPPRRYDDTTLADFAGLSSTIACECPSHVAELLGQLSRFEDYSAQCASLSPADAALHCYLQQVAGQARALFEQALERVAVHEGLVLPR
jgi:DNA-binding transcriptional MerR regulator